ncbi:MAG: hypothetical protein LKE40_13040 [Spirochaetia bacterium]|jgi:hypothetical protein|nr:hypothetical protein [Spirochaetia bacterium]
MSDFLFARPSILEGIARNIDLFGILNEYNDSNTSEEADYKAYLNDINVLKQDMNIAHEVICANKI